MLKTLGINLNIFANYAFGAVTSWVYIDVVKLLKEYESFKELPLEGKVAIVVLFLSLCYWFLRLVDLLMSLPYKWRARKREEAILKLKHDAEIRKIENNHLTEDLEKLSNLKI